VVLTATVFIRQTWPRQPWGAETVATVGMPATAASSAAAGGVSSETRNLGAGADPQAHGMDAVAALLTLERLLGQI
jgi:hypothetical protein